MTLLSVFLLGLLGGLHCVGMCGGLVAAMNFRPLATKSGSPVEFMPGITKANQSVLTARVQPPPVDLRPLFINAGRIVTYTMLGAVAGAASSTVWVLENVLPVQRGLFLLSCLLMLLVGGWLLGLRGPLLWTEKLGHRFWRRLQPLAARRLSATRPSELFMAGAVWGFIPCGMVYMVLLAALSAGNALNGALLMAVFGLGTLPNLLLMGAGSQWLGRFGGATGLRRTIAVVVIGMALLGVYRAVTLQPLDPSIFCLIPGGSGTP